MWSAVQFPKVANRTTTSIVLLAVLMATILTPAGMCALMCERHYRAESQRHCISSSDSDTMPGMAHDHSAMNHLPVEASSLVLVSQSCQTSCVTAERLGAWRKGVPQVTAIESPIVLAATVELLAPGAAAWSSDSGPPVRHPAYSASFTVLRI